MQIRNFISKYRLCCVSPTPPGDFSSISGYLGHTLIPRVTGRVIGVIILIWRWECGWR
uniref:Uncharacterized protein n=1 Tax=Macaca nemestrina TaxID=9545 RepID=A0A2K6B1Y9_MACNE